MAVDEPPGPESGLAAGHHELGRRALGTTSQVAEYLGVPVATLHVWRSRSKGPAAIRVGKHLRWRWETVDDWLDAQGKL